jgi:signal transduction histidine kinase
MNARSRVLWGAVFGAVGFALNLRVFDVLPSAHFLLGPLAVLSAAVLLGPVGGGVAGALGALPTVWHWGHPFGWLNFTLEAVVVGALARRWTPLPATLAYWLLSPLYFLLTYHLVAGIPGPVTAVMAVKQLVNSALLVLLVQAVLLLPAVRGLLAGWLPAPMRDVGLTTAFGTILLLSALVPLVLLGVAEGRARYQAELERLAAEDLNTAHAISDEIERTLAHARQVSARRADKLAAASTDGALPPQGVLDGELAELVGYSPELTAAYVGTPAGRAVGFFPARNARGQPLVGTDYADRPYVRQLPTATEPLVTGVFEGRGGVEGPLVIIAAPIRRDGRYLGYVLAGLNVARLGEYVLSQAQPGQRALVVDPDGDVVSDTQRVSEGRVASIRNSSLDEALARSPLGQGAVYVARPHPLWALRAASQHHFAAVAVPSLDWRVVVEQSTVQLQRRLERSYLGLLGALGAALLVLLLLSTALVRGFLTPLRMVAEAAQSLGRGGREARVRDAARHAPLELQDLARRFDEMAEQLARQLHVVEAAAREKDEFLTIAAHELRTPLTVLKVQTQLLRRQPGADPAARLDTFVRQVDRLTRLVNQLMDASQLSSGRLPLEPSQVDVAELVRRVAEPAVAASPAHTLALRAEPAEGWYDELRLEQVFHNLLSNAIKYSPTGGSVEVEVGRSAAGGVVVSVADRGIGLGDPEKQRLFERFARGDSDALKGISGLGVGLYVSREIVRLHHGSISLVAREGGGAVARVELPASGREGAAGPAHRVA